MPCAPPARVASAESGICRAAGPSVSSGRESLRSAFGAGRPGERVDIDSPWGYLSSTVAPTALSFFFRAPRRFSPAAPGKGSSASSNEPPPSSSSTSHRCAAMAVAARTPGGPRFTFKPRRIAGRDLQRPTAVREPARDGAVDVRRGAGRQRRPGHVRSRLSTAWPAIAAPPNGRWLPKANGPVRPFGVGDAARRRGFARGAGQLSLHREVRSQISFTRAAPPERRAKSSLCVSRMPG